MSDQVQEEKKPTIEEIVAMRTEQLNQTDSSIITVQGLIANGKIKVIADNEEPEPLTLSISGKEMISAMLSPVANKLLKDRGSLSFDLDQYKKSKE